jgi:D-alanyl-D-alanine carboxypeptidase/D-alanyl-D-alanine-endopeptidase (penicillin-binding protein 4)
MIRIGALLLLSAFLLGCAAAPHTEVSMKPNTFAELTSTSPYPKFKGAIDRFLPDSLFPPSNVGIKIVSLTEDETLYELNSEMLFNPASNQKLFTAAAAISTLGMDYTLATVFTVDTAAGVIGVKAHGDPILSTTDADSIARRLVPLLPARASWELVSDVSYFDDVHRGTGWTWDSEPAAYAAYITPLILNGNTIQVTVRPGTTAGDTLTVKTDPVTGYVSLENSGVTVSDTVRERLRISRKWRERLNTITVRGEMIDSGRRRKASISLWEPDRYAATVLAERLNRYGVPVGTVTLDTARIPGIEILRFTHGLDSALTFMNKISDNLTAESLLKILAAERSGPPGSADAGISVIYQFLSQHRIDTTGIRLADGSGVSRYNLVSTSVIIQLLRAMYNTKSLFDPFYHSLPIAGVDGTIWYRMRGTSAENNLRAKTGTLSGVSILMQNYPSSSRRYRKVQDRIGEFLAEFSRRFY